ncbi:hypothetical protein DICSQDRAFT_138731 [Dichomitus squalens LYAD-421 SS1]|uniref:Uncharacterized protein n=1 Tax=Dichomitus squalens (strain LYAD-421) TaxID=732165 RepID=R7ST84_DICSQ|nr:uncharacterized protein DICSQDRAFT_138731 [Dichomitus squalens LYAD-421 SS1]EJF59143.1 hypothetical protein DICSQDRAFT_138731 [Dichomitus squalens LYAD-421 SS1]
MRSRDIGESSQLSSSGKSKAQLAAALIMAPDISADSGSRCAPTSVALVETLL